MNRFPVVCRFGGRPPVQTIPTRSTLALAEHPVWQRVALSPPMLDNLRQMLINGDPSMPDCYGVMMEAVIADDDDTFDAFVPTISVRIGDYHFVRRVSECDISTVANPVAFLKCGDRR